MEFRRTDPYVGIEVEFINEAYPGLRDELQNELNKLIPIESGIYKEETDDEFNFFKLSIEIVHDIVEDKPEILFFRVHYNSRNKGLFYPIVSAFKEHPKFRFIE